MTGDMPPFERWEIELICCGTDDGIQTCPSWEHANEYRDYYVGASEGHARVGIISRAPNTALLGWRPSQQVVRSNPRRRPA